MREQPGRAKSAAYRPPTEKSGQINRHFAENTLLMLSIRLPATSESLRRWPDLPNEASGYYQTFDNESSGYIHVALSKV